MKQVYLLKKDRIVIIDDKPYHFTQDIRLEHHFGEEGSDDLYKIIGRKNSCNLEIVFRGELKYVIYEITAALQQLRLLLPVSNNDNLERLLSVLLKEED